MSISAWCPSFASTKSARGRQRSHGWLARIALSIFCIAASYANAADPQVSIDIKDLVLDYSWGYSTGIKQHQGSFKDGRSVHAVSRFSRVNPNPNLEDLGNPDWLMWVDETTGEASIHEHPVGEFGEGINPGGNVTFGTDVPASDTGYMWWVLGARAETVPFDLARSVAPFDPRDFDVVLNDFETVDKSTAVTLSVKGQAGMVVYRYLRSTSPVGKVLFKRFNLQPGTPQLERVRELGWAGSVPDLGDITIEQVWTRWDPRRGALAATWQWFARDVQSNGDVIKYFGSNPFIYTEDFGETWRLADGSLATLPLRYATNNATISPYDHLAARETTLWFTRDIGFTPNGTPWMSIPSGPDQDMRFFFYSQNAWRTRTLTTDLEGGDPVACGTTKNYVVCLFSERARPGVLLLRMSADNGDTWSAPQAVDTIPRTPAGALQKIAWVSFVQPSDGYPNDVARFFYGYWDTNDGAAGRDYGNNMRWIRLGLGNTDPTVNITSPADVSSQAVGTPIVLTAAASDPDGDTVTVTWTANGTAITEPWLPVAGDYTIVATASDGHGGSATDSVSITVSNGNADPTIDITSPVDGSHHLTGTPIPLAASTGDADGDTVTVTWTANGNAISAPWTPVAGNYTVVATANDGHGGSANDSVSITVAANQNPTIDITSPVDGAEHFAGTAIPLAASTGDADGHTVTVAWTANGNPISEPWTPAAGSYTVAATASDGHGGSADDSVSITVREEGSPTVDITSPLDGSQHVTGTPIPLAADTSDPDGDPVVVSWTANGGPIAEPWTPAPGSYTVVATADDGNGGTASDSVGIAVADPNQDPTVNITSPVDGSSRVAGATIPLSADTDDPDGDTVTVAWTANGNPVSAPWTAAAGTYTVVANADDGNGGSASDSVSISVTANQDPTVDITSPVGGSSHVAGSTIPLTATTGDADGHTVSVAWTANGNPIAAPWTPAAGSYTVAATASDGHGGSASDSVSITVTNANQDPTIDITSPVAGSSHVAGSTIPLTATTGDADGHAVTVAWTTNGNPIAAPWTPAAGSYTVVATASDGHGGSATDSVNTTVTASGSGTLPTTVAAVGVNTATASRLIDTLSGVQNLATSWSNNGSNSTAWFTLDLGSTKTVERLRIAPHGGVRYTFTVTIGNTLSGGKATGAAAGTCSMRSATDVPTTLDLCAVSGVGRYVTVQGSRPWLIVHGIEVVGSAAPASNVLPATIHDAGANDVNAPRIIDVLNGAQNLTTNWSNDGVNSTAWFTVDLGSQQSIGRLMVAPRGELKYTLTITIGNTVSGGKVTGSATGSCAINGPTQVPTSLTQCSVSGTGRYITVQGNRPWLLFYGFEAWKP
jgi:hypothetical protein